MKAWWVTKGWPFLKENWWSVLLAPLALLVIIAMLAVGLFRSRLTVIDPVAGADARAQLEAERRAQQLEEEKAKLEARIAELEQQYAELQVRFEKGLADEVEALRDDPERLRALMLRVGPGDR